MRYFRRPWDETRGDEHDGWGTAVYYLEVGPDHFATRQLEVHANGVRLKDDEARPTDPYGGLADQALALEEEGFLPFEIGRDEFEAAWEQPSFNAR